MARTNKGFTISAQKLKTRMRNDQTFAAYFNQLRYMAETSFKWEGFPKYIDPTIVERWLFQYGLCAVFEDPVVGVMVLPAMQSGGFNLNDMPKMIRAFSPRTGFSQLLNYSIDPELSECILIHNQNRDLSAAMFRTTLFMYAERLTEMKRTEDINVYAQRTPITMTVPESQVETYTNLIDRYQNFGQIIFGYKGLDVDCIKALKTEAPFIAGQVDELFIKTWNEAIGYLGISNVSIYKKERVSTDEVARAMGGAIAFRNTRQDPRERAVELCNEKYGLDLKVTFSEDLFDQDMFASGDGIPGNDLNTQGFVNRVQVTGGANND